jgi:hypothetical protein
MYKLSAQYFSIISNIANSTHKNPNADSSVLWMDLTHFGVITSVLPAVTDNNFNSNYILVLFRRSGDLDAATRLWATRK